MRKYSFKVNALAFSVMFAFGSGAAYADEVVVQNAAEQTAQELTTVNVKAARNRAPTTERLNRETITREMIRDNRDLVRYSADVGVSENGRHSKGFAMRGVDDNRVGIAIDGISLPDSEENSLYKRYGNFNNSRLRIDPELVRGIDVVKGSDSVNFGSGSLGGNVNYRTLSASDIVQAERNFGGLLRSGYSTKNREWANTIGLGFQNETFDAAILYSHRYGHETQNHDDTAAPFEKTFYMPAEKLAEHGMHRIEPDPSTHQQNSWLAKFGWQITPAHRISLTHSGQRSSNRVNQYSYEAPLGVTGRDWRDVNDRQRMYNTTLSYEFTPETTPIASIKADAEHSRTLNGTDVYNGQFKAVSGPYSTDYGTERDYTRSYYQRNNKTKFTRLSLGAEMKPFDLGGQHTLSFKIFGSQRDFENINDDRFFNRDGTLEDRGWVNFSRGIRMPNPDVYTIQHPIKTKSYGFVLQDKIKWNNILSSNVAIRYDHEKYSPQASNVECGNATRMGRLCGAAEDKTFRNWSGSLGLDAQLNDNWKIGYQIGSGFRNPTASEMYFTFESFSGNWFANPALKAERSLNHNLTLSGSGRYGKLELSAYHSRYRNFLYEREGWVNVENPFCTSSWCDRFVSTPFQQFHNADSAKISGIEFKGSLNLDSITPLPQGFKFSTALGWSKGSMSSEGRKINLLAIQPLKAVIGLDYEHPDEKWGVFSRLTYNKGKKPKDAQYLQGERDCVRGENDPWFGGFICKEWGSAPPSVQQFPWQNKSSWVFDLFGYYRPVKNLTLRAGIYNVFNRKYHSWDTLRGLNFTGTADRVARSRASERGNHNQGLERYTAPGRNYAVSLEYKF